MMPQEKSGRSPSHHSSGRVAGGIYIVAIEVDAQHSADTSAEAQEIFRALETHRWRRTAAARSLGISRATLWRRMRALIPFSAAGADHLAERFTSVTEAAILGIIVTAIAQALTIGLGVWIVGLPNPLLWAALTAVVSVLPILGSALVWIPGVVVLLLSDRPGAALALGLIGAIVASNVDNVIRPVIYRRVSGLHPMAGLLGAFAGVELFGLLGLVLGPLAIAYCLELIRLYEMEYGAAP